MEHSLAASFSRTGKLEAPHSFSDGPCGDRVCSSSKLIKVPLTSLNLLPPHACSQAINTSLLLGKPKTLKYIHFLAYVPSHTNACDEIHMFKKGLEIEKLYDEDCIYE